MPLRLPTWVTPYTVYTCETSWWCHLTKRSTICTKWQATLSRRKRRQDLRKNSLTALRKRSNQYICADVTVARITRRKINQAPTTARQQALRRYWGICISQGKTHAYNKYWKAHSSTDTGYVCSDATALSKILSVFLQLML